MLHRVLTSELDRCHVCYTASLIRVFTYMGFKLLPPGHPFVPAASGDIMYLAYAIDIDAGGGDSD